MAYSRCSLPCRFSVVRLIALGVCVFVALAAAVAPASSSAAPGDIGYRDQAFNGAGKAPTGSKPESKLWWNDGYWWANMWDTASGDFHIFRLDTVTQRWVDTGVAIDDRAGTRADTLWDGTHLYVASHVFSEAPANGHPSRLYRFSYNPLTQTYSRDAGFPVSINNYKTETLVIDKDSTGKLWATWTQGSQVMVNRTTTGDANWGSPFVLPASGATRLSNDDISSVVAFGGNKLGVMWSSQTNSAVYFAIHNDGQSDSTWQQSRTAIAGPNYADDHINLKSLQSVGGRVFAVVKTSLEDVPNANPNMPQVMVLSRDPANGDWSSAVFGRISEDHTRPILMVDETNRVLHVFATAPVTGGAIYEKTSPLDSISFPNGLGTPVIRDGATPNVNNVTSTKQSVTSRTGLVVMASNDSTNGSYWHAYKPVPGQAPPSAGFSASPTSGTAPLAVSFSDSSTNSPTSWSWDFGDGTSSTAQNPSHTYSAPGSYTVRLTATNAGGSDTETRTNYITVAAPPTAPSADFSATPTSGSAPLAVSFSDSSTNDPTSWSWDFGDGTTSTAQNPSHTYAIPGTYSVSLTASNSAGSDTETRTDYITVAAPPAPPSADFSANPTNGTAPLAVAFSDSSTDNPTSWSWDFGDGTSSTAQNPNHTYTTPGTYSVSLTASNSAGSDTETRTDYITVAAPTTPPSAGFSANPTSGSAPLAVAFSDSSTNNPTSWSWDFGDGTSSTAQNPNHTYTTPGTYSVSLTASNAAGPDTETRTDYITVSAPTASYRSLVLGDGPLSYWRLGETTGTTASDSAGSNTGAVKSGVTLGAPGALAGDTDTSMTFDGTSGYVSVPNSASLNPTGDLTVEVWAKPGLLDSRTRAIVHKGGTSGYPSYQYRLGLASSNFWRGTVYIGSTNFTVTSPNVAKALEWTHLAMTRSGSTLRLYLNGVAVATSTASGALNTSTGILAIGRTGSVSVDYFKGSIDEVAVYPSALSAAAIAEHYRIGVGG